MINNWILTRLNLGLDYLSYEIFVW